MASKTKFQDQNVKHLAALKNLGWVTLDHTSVTGAGFDTLKNLPVYSLDLSDTKVNDEGLKAIGQLKGLKRLYLPRTAVTDEGYSTLRDWAQLTDLNLQSTKVTGSGFGHLKASIMLESLDASRNPAQRRQLEAANGVQGLWRRWGWTRPP